MKAQFHSLLQDGSIFRRCVEDSNDTVMITDTRGVLHFVNRAWIRVYGYTWQDAIGKSPAIIRSKHQDENFYRGMWDQIRDPRIGYWKGELVNRAKDGREVPVFLSITPFNDESGRGLGYMGVAVDITEKKALEAQLLHQDRLASLGVISAGLAHEIGNPLGVIRGRAEYLGILMGDNQAAKQNLEIVVNQIDRIAKLMYSLLHLARGTRSETLSAVGLRAVALKVLELLGPSIEKEEAAVHVQFADDLRIMAEPILLEQVLLNLGMNAVQAIEAARLDGRRTGHSVTLSAAAAGDFWEISVADTGCGIAESNLKEIFKPFFTTKAPEVGTGLGLSICDQIVRGWGGSVSVTSWVGVGTTVMFRVPKA